MQTSFFVPHASYVDGGVGVNEKEITSGVQYTVVFRGFRRDACIFDLAFEWCLVCSQVDKILLPTRRLDMSLESSMVQPERKQWIHEKKVL